MSEKVVISADARSFLENVWAVVELGSDWERHQLWENNQRRPDDDPNKVSWLDNLSGYGYTVGLCDMKPVFISVRIAILNGVEIAFYEATSQVVDHTLINRWLREHLPKDAFKENDHLREVSANNFIHLVHDIQRKSPPQSLDQRIEEWLDFKDARDGSQNPGYEWVGELLDTFEKVAFEYRKRGAAMKHFVERVDRGEVKSKRTYAQFKELLK